MWLFLGIFSALSLGIYDVCKKLSLQKNAVIPVLFISIVISSTLLMPFFFLSKMVPETIQNSIFFVPDISWEAHLLILLKSVRVHGIMSLITGVSLILSGITERFGVQALIIPTKWDRAVLHRSVN